MCSSDLGTDPAPFPVEEGHNVRWAGPTGFEAGRFVRWVERRAGHPLRALIRMFDGSERRIDADVLRPSNDDRTRRLRGGVFLADPGAERRREESARRRKESAR